MGPVRPVGRLHPGAGTAPGSTVPLPVSHLDATAEQGLDQWWQLYRDPGLNAAVQEALSQNRDLRMAAANLLQARALLRETDTLRQPSTQVTARAGYGSTADDQLEAALQDSQHIRTGSRYGVGLDVQWEADLFGRLHGLAGAARLMPRRPGPPKMACGWWWPRKPPVPGCRPAAMASACRWRASPWRWWSRAAP